MRNIKLTLSYDGTDFNGWQTQPGYRTVQETLELAIAKLTGEAKIRVNASGRTDAGVHAVGQVVNFYSNTVHPPEVLVRAINAHLPADVIVREAADMPQSFDANRDAKRKLYRYVIHDGAVPDPFLRRYAYHARHKLDLALMQAAAQPLVGRHDFHSFETDWPNRMSSVRTITHLSVSRLPSHPLPIGGEGHAFLSPLSPWGRGAGGEGAGGEGAAGNWIWLDVEADGFLYNMVRAIAGTLINVGRGYWPVEHVAQILQAEDRAQAGPTAPAQGLFLMRVTYER